MTLVLAGLFVIVAPLAVIAALAAAGKNFFDGSIAGGVSSWPPYSQWFCSCPHISCGVAYCERVGR
jgi:hypothetical protein